MRILTLRCRTPVKDLLLAELWERGTAGVLETELPDSVWELEAWFEEDFDAGVFGESPTWRDETPAPDWRAGWQPLAVGQKLWLVPDWIDAAPPAGRLPIRVHPGRASGSGYQPATQLALEALENHLKPNATVLDAGTGTGILLSAARALGAGKLLGCDIDPEAAEIARANLAADQVAAHIWTGSPRSANATSCDLLLANLNGATIHELRREFARVLRPGGTLVLSGFTERWRARIETEFRWHAAELLEQGEWRALVLTAPLVSEPDSKPSHSR